jgi:hypothetical protein
MRYVIAESSCKPRNSTDNSCLLRTVAICRHLLLTESSLYKVDKDISDLSKLNTPSEGLTHI